MSLTYFLLSMSITVSEDSMAGGVPYEMPLLEQNGFLPDLAAIPADVLDPSASWGDKAEYDRRYKDLASRFVQNFAKFAEETSQDVIAAGPKA